MSNSMNECVSLVSIQGEEDLVERYGSISSQPIISTSITAPLSSGSIATIATTTSTNIPILVAAFLSALATGGPTYAFGVYGATLKETLHLSQASLDTLSSANFCAGFVSWIPGMCLDHWGSRIGLLVGGTVMSLVLTLYWLVSRQFIPFSEQYVVPILSFLGFMIFMANSLVVGSLFKALVISSNTGKGAAVGAAKGYLGLGAGVYSSLFNALRHDQQSDLDFLIMAAVLSILAIAIPGWFCLPPKHTFTSGTNIILDTSTPRHYHVIYAALFALAALVVGTSCLSMFTRISQLHTTTSATDIHNQHQHQHQHHPDIKTIILLLVSWWGPILSLFVLPKSVVSPPSEDDNTETTPLDAVSQASPYMSRLGGRSSKRSIDKSRKLRGGKRIRDYDLSEMLNTTTAWLFLWALIILVGSGTIMTNNMGQMIESLGFPKEDTMACMSLFSVAQAAARVATGDWSEQALKWKRGGQLFGLDSGLPRPVFLVVSCFVSITAHSILAIATERTYFVAGVLLSGVGFGMIWPLMVLIVGDVFGTLNHGANYLFYDGCTSALGTLLISKYIAQTVYEHHIHNGSEDYETACFGPECFQNSHIAVAILSATAAVSSTAVLFMTKSSYGRALL